ncbi:hypothetical protein HAX54_017361, partial [Datura stramonium]|nr:hypothetical protein [Datura stramonium]
MTKYECDCCWWIFGGFSISLVGLGVSKLGSVNFGCSLELMEGKRKGGFPVVDFSGERGERVCSSVREETEESMLVWWRFPAGSEGEEMRGREEGGRRWLPVSPKKQRRAALR